MTLVFMVRSGNGLHAGLRLGVVTPVLLLVFCFIIGSGMA